MTLDLGDTVHRGRVSWAVITSPIKTIVNSGKSATYVHTCGLDATRQGKTSLQYGGRRTEYEVLVDYSISSEWRLGRVMVKHSSFLSDRIV